MKKKLHPKLLNSKIPTLFKDSLFGKIPFFNTLVFMVGFLFYGSFNVSAQSYPNVHQNYFLVEENHKEQVEVSIMVAQCSSASSDSIYVMIFNEKATKDTVDFDLTITKEDKSDSKTKTISYIMDVAQMAIPSCGDGLLRNLVFALPSGYDPKKTTFTVKFK